MATSIRPVSLDEAREAAVAIDELLQRYPTVAAATLGDGTTVTVRRADGVDDVAVALCVEGSTPTCQQPAADADPGAPAHVAAVFDVGDQRRIVAWHETDGQLGLVVEGGVGDSLPTEVLPAREGEGWFATTAVPSGLESWQIAVSVGTGDELSYFFPLGGAVPR